MSRLLWRPFVCLLLAMVWVIAGGCNEREDKRTTDEKLYAPAPDIKTRLYMACPLCGCPQRPYRITEIKSYYHCQGNPPKFPYHTIREWQHTLERDECKPRVEF
ncbi:MAG TPA: hypothetical protein VKX17_00300 [Planctomycetota bacterium]|nr:hypothetical protein [Planctomycetota bacterium]